MGWLSIVGWLLLFLGVVSGSAIALAGLVILGVQLFVVVSDRMGAEDAERDHDHHPRPRRTYQSDRRALSSRTTSGASSATSGVGLKGRDRNGLTLVHSPSAVKLYKDCPHKYMRLRVKKDVEDETGPAGKGATVYMTRCGRTLRS